MLRPNCLRFLQFARKPAKKQHGKGNYYLSHYWSLTTYTMPVLITVQLFDLDMFSLRSLVTVVEIMMITIMI